MSDTRSRAWDVIGWFGAAAASAVVPSAIGVYTGSFATVAEFASSHPGESALWSISFIGVGMIAGLAVRSGIASRQIRDKDAVIAELEKRPTREELDKAVRDATRPLREEIAEKEAIIDKLESKPSSRDMLERLLPGFSRATLRAIVKAYDADGMVEAETDDETMVLASVQSKQGVFIMEAVSMLGATKTTGKYTLNDKFRLALSECPDILERIRELAS